MSSFSPLCVFPPSQCHPTSGSEGCYQLEVDLAGNITLGMPAWGANGTQAGMVHFSGPGPSDNQGLPQSIIVSGECGPYYIITRAHIITRRVLELPQHPYTHTRDSGVTLITRLLPHRRHTDHTFAASPTHSQAIPLGSSPTMASWLTSVAFFRNNPIPGVAFHYTSTAAGITNGTADITAHRRPNSVAIMVVITDGGANLPASPPGQAAVNVEAAANAARAKNITVVAIGITNGADYNASQILAIAGGQPANAITITSFNNLAATFAAILRNATAVVSVVAAQSERERENTT